MNKSVWLRVRVLCIARVTYDRNYLSLSVTSKIIPLLEWRSYIIYDSYRRVSLLETRLKRDARISEFTVRYELFSGVAITNKVSHVSYDWRKNQQISNIIYSCWHVIERNTQDKLRAIINTGRGILSPIDCWRIVKCSWNTYVDETRTSRRP